MRKRVLIVDDEFGLADLIAEVLTEEGYDVAIAINGRLGLARLEEGGVDIVLLDVMMPVLDGPAMLQAMRADPRFASVPVILMTALPEAVPRGQPRLHQAVLHKPFAPDELFALLERLLKPAE